MNNEFIMLSKDSISGYKYNNFSNKRMFFATFIFYL